MEQRLNNNSDQRSDIICPCSGTRKEKIIQLIHSGKDSLREISAATGACSGCGACDILVLALIDEHKLDK